jgi:hypothetical protein
MLDLGGIATVLSLAAGLGFPDQAATGITKSGSAVIGCALGDGRESPGAPCSITRESLPCSVNRSRDEEPNSRDDCDCFTVPYPDRSGRSGEVEGGIVSRSDA